MASTIPNDYVLDVHDLAAIILDSHALSDTTLPHAQLVEVYRDGFPLRSLPPHVLPPIWDELPLNQRRVAYLLKTDHTTTEQITFDRLRAPEGVKTPGDKPLTRRELEDIYWRCKDYDNGYMLAYVAQSVFEKLPPTAKLRVRTSQGHEITCSPSAVTVAEVDIQPHEACLIIDYKPRPDISPHHVDMVQHLSGFDSSLPWIMLMIGDAVAVPAEQDKRCYLDLVTPQIGGRGGGGELFSLEQAHYYHDKLLPRFATEFEAYKHSAKLRLSPPDVRRRGEALTGVVMERLARIANGDNRFCRYCGKDGVEMRCSKCKDAHFCKDCQALGWKYHKVWCTPA